MGKASEIWKEIKPKIGEMLAVVNDVETRAEKAQEEAYQKGLSDAWEAARKVVALSTVDRREVFGSEYMYSILEKHTASEAIEKIRQYEQEKDGLQQNIQTIVDQCGYTLDEIAAALNKMREDAPT